MKEPARKEREKEVITPHCKTNQIKTKMSRIACTRLRMVGRGILSTTIPNAKFKKQTKS